MKDAESMTPDELRVRADELRALADEKEDIPVKRGILKHDLYKPLFDGIDIKKETDYTLLTEHQRDVLIEKFSKGFEKALPKGTTFIAYRYDGGEIVWYDYVLDTYGYEYDEEWAEQNLENITDVVNGRF